MTALQHTDLPVAWTQVIQRRAPSVAQAFLADARRYLADGAPERVPAGREAETLKNLVFAYLEPAEHEAVLYEFAVTSLLAPPKGAAATGAGLFALGSVAVLSLALVRSRR